MSNNFINNHYSVLLTEVVELMLKTGSDAAQSNYFDGTFGGGGYSINLSNRLLEKNRKFQIYACDLDNESSKFCPENLFINFKNANFAEYIQEFPDHSLSGIVLDLGFSTNQLLSSKRGFSYKEDNDILDLRYNHTEGLPLHEKLKRLRGSKELSNIIFQNSGEELSRRIAENIFLNRKSIKTVIEFKSEVDKSIPIKFFYKRNSIYSRVWQAMRIWVNEEFVNIEKFLPIALSKLEKNGILVIVNFHSLEDKIVTKFFRNESQPLVLDEYGNKKTSFEFLTPKAIEPSLEEININTASRSAKLRAIKKL